MLGSGNNILYPRGSRIIWKIHVGNDRKPKDGHAGVDRCNHLGYGGEPHRIDAYDFEKLNLSSGFKRGTGESSVNAFSDLNTIFKGSVFSKPHQMRVVHLRHVWKPRAPLIDVRSDKGIVAGKIDVVRDNHNIADIKPRIDSASSIGQYEGLDSQQLHDSHRESDFLHAVPFIVVKSSLHGDDRFSRHVAAQKSSMVGWDC